MDSVKKSNVELIAKHPLAWVIALVASIASGFVYRNFEREDVATAGCKQAIATANARADQYQKQLIDMLTLDKIKENEARRVQDSIINAVVGKRAKSIIKNSK